ncbi:acyltransferase domain-containing protein, partial [Nonomuraea sp. NPDC049709]|uniref:acyltransferase domain-containing protein n=1 Tax=Nonomuraea sp. NPDC049709 TaxID=3154736 RepID=UPI0034239BCD
MVLALERRVLPPTLHVSEPTPHVDWSAGGVRLLTGAVELPGSGPVRAGVSSFGVSGTNAHVIVESAPEVEDVLPVRGPVRGPVVGGGAVVWVVSGRSAAALRGQAARLVEFAAGVPDGELAGVGRVLAGRSVFGYRAVVVASDRAELLAGLAAVAAGESHAAVVSGSAVADAQPVLVFPGQGSQWAGMAVELLECCEVFRAEVERCDRVVRSLTGWSVVGVLRGAAGAPGLEGSPVVQPVLWAVMVGLAAVWRAAGVAPRAVVGQSQGEMAAACVAGVLSLEDAARVVVLRSRALEKVLGTGGMAALDVSASRAGELIGSRWAGRLWVAVHSGPASCVVAGEVAALEELEQLPGVRVRRVAVDYASHTPHMDRLAEELGVALAGVRPVDGAGVGFCSSVEGGFLDAARLSGRYWVENLCRPVLFEESVRAAAGVGGPVFVEVSPHPVLVGDVEDICRAAGVEAGVCGSLRRGEGGSRRMLLSLAQAWVLGVPVAWPLVLGEGPAPSGQPPT